MHHNVPTVYDLGLMKFRDNVARNPRIKDRLLKTLLSMIQQERTGEVINKSLLKSITQMLIDLGVNSRAVYEEDFEKPFLDTSSSFYRLESQDFIATNSCSEYMKKVSWSFYGIMLHISFMMLIWATILVGRGKNQGGDEQSCTLFGSKHRAKDQRSCRDPINSHTHEDTHRCM